MTTTIPSDQAIKVSPKTLIDLLKILLPEKKNILMTGRPGIGKTAIGFQIAAMLKYDIIVSHPVIADPVDYKGFPFIVDGKAVFIPFEELEQLMNVTRPTLFFLDDFGQATATVQAACMQLLHGRTINGKRISDEVRIIAATNRRQDKAAVTSILEPVQSRFWIFELDPTVDDWVTWALGTDMPIELIAAVRFKPEWITEWSPTKDISNTPCPRNLEEVGEIMKKNIPKKLWHPMYSARLGTGAATELVTFLSLYKDLPSIDDIVNEPNDTIIPHEKGSLYALVTALGQHADKNNISSLDTYIKRIRHKEYHLLFWKDIQRHGNGLTSTIEYVNYAANNAHLLLDI